MRRETRDEAFQLEVMLLIEAVYQTYGYDFRGYRLGPLVQSLHDFCVRNKIPSLSAYIGRVIRDEATFHDLLPVFSVSVTEFFRDPVFFRALADEGLPRLRSWPSLKAWHAGCATGEEAYSMAILLDEAGLLDRTRIYATDIDTEALAVVRHGTYGLADIRKGSENYRSYGGKARFSAYCRAGDHGAVMNQRLRERITASRHNLVTDASFGEMHAIFCRNVLIYFNRDLRARFWQLVETSLVRGGLLCLGRAERLPTEMVGSEFEVLNAEQRIYRKLYHP